jgi:hypothetical protein
MCLTLSCSEEGPDGPRTTLPRCAGTHGPDSGYLRAVLWVLKGGTLGTQGRWYGADRQERDCVDDEEMLHIPAPVGCPRHLTRCNHIAPGLAVLSQQRTVRRCCAGKAAATAPRMDA